MNCLNIHIYIRDCTILDESITNDVVKNAIYGLKSNKAHRLDLKVYEYLKI